MLSPPLRFAIAHSDLNSDCGFSTHHQPFDDDLSSPHNQTTSIISQYHSSALSHISRLLTLNFRHNGDERRDQYHRYRDDYRRTAAIESSSAYKSSAKLDHDNANDHDDKTTTTTTTGNGKHAAWCAANNGGLSRSNNWNMRYGSWVSADYRSN